MSTLSETAKQYLGKREKPNNQGWDDQVFERKMLAVGWKKGEAYCAYTIELVAKETFPERFKEFDKLFSASAVQTFKNFQQAGFTISKTPVVDSIVIWQHYKDGKPEWTGHAGICVKKTSDTLFQSIEGNTIEDNAKGNSREGYIIALKQRSTTPKKNGLNVMGFISLDKK